jgi:hypothetical protein
MKRRRLLPNVTVVVYSEFGQRLMSAKTDATATT